MPSRKGETTMTTETMPPRELSKSYDPASVEPEAAINPAQGRDQPRRRAQPKLLITRRKSA